MSPEGTKVMSEIKIINVPIDLGMSHKAIGISTSSADLSQTVSSLSI